jgi:hypothetical protein
MEGIDSNYATGKFTVNIRSRANRQPGLEGTAPDFDFQALFDGGLEIDPFSDTDLFSLETRPVNMIDSLKMFIPTFALNGCGGGTANACTAEVGYPPQPVFSFTRRSPTAYS